jgi:hypothetical protein
MIDKLNIFHVSNYTLQAVFLQLEMILLDTNFISSSWATCAFDFSRDDLIASSDKSESLSDAN